MAPAESGHGEGGAGGMRFRSRADLERDLESCQTAVVSILVEKNLLDCHGNPSALDALDLAKRVAAVLQATQFALSVDASPIARGHFATLVRKVHNCVETYEHLLLRI